MLQPLNLFFSALFAIGAYIVVAGLLRRPPLDDLSASRPPLGQRVLEPGLLFLHNLLQRDRAAGAAPEFDSEQNRRKRVGQAPLDPVSFRLTIDDRLLRSGFRYETVGAFYGAKILGAVALFVMGAVVGTLLKLPLLLTVALAAGLGVLGLTTPDMELKKAIAARRQALFREMAWTLDRIAVLLETGLALDNALSDLLWVSQGRGGLFLALLRDLVAARHTQQVNTAELLLRLKKTVPELPELNEFFRLVQLSIDQGQAIAEQTRVLAEFMRDELTNQIEERRQAAELKVVFLTSAIIVPALLVVVGGPAVISFLRNIV